MPFMPFNILGIWFKGLLSVAILAGGIYLLRQWYKDAHVIEPARARATDDATEPRDGNAPGRRVFRWNLGWNRETGELAGGLALLTLALAGRPILGGFTKLGLKQGSDDPRDADADPKPDRGGRHLRIRRPDGSEIEVETYGPPDAPTVVLTHGWGVDSTEWYYVKKAVARGLRVVVWDLPGLGMSKKPDNNDYRLEKMADDLDAVLKSVGDRPVVLAGHSIGGMILLTYCRMFPAALGPRVAGLVLVHTTYTNPVRTTKGAAFYTAIETPVIVPLLYLTIGLWPLVWLMNWMSYMNGSVHRSTHKQSYAGAETRGQLDFASRFPPHDRPDVLARGMLGMLAYDATATLATIGIPVRVVTGDVDTTTPPEAGQFMARTIPNAELVTLSPARHLGLIEHHEEFDRTLAEFTNACLHAGAVGGTAG